VHLHELEGMQLHDPDGATLGVVRTWYKVPQGYILEVETPRGVRDVPFNAAFVRTVDREARSLVDDVPDGLLD
jgi:ribosomal 30S subunit maturation factor RimM